MNIRRFKIPLLILMVISSLFLPFWLTVILFILGVFVFETFYFGIVLLVFMDVVYGFQGFLVGPFHGSISIFGILAYAVIQIIKTKTFGLGRSYGI